MGQVMKQLSANPSVDSTTKGWELLQNMVKVALPSAEVYEFLLAFVHREAAPPEPEDDEEDTPTKKSGWKHAFFDVVKRLRVEQAEMHHESGNFNMSGLVGLALQEERMKKQKSEGGKERKSMLERQLSREKRKSRAAEAESREAGAQAKRKALA